MRTLLLKITICFAIMMCFLTTLHAQFPTYTANFATNYADWTPVGTNVWTVSGDTVKQTSASSIDPCKLLLTPTSYSYKFPYTKSQGIIAKVRVDSWQSNNDLSRAGISLTDSLSNAYGYCLLFHDINGTKYLQFLSDLTPSSGWSTGTTFNFTVGVWYWFKMEIINSTMYGKVWQDGTAEPAAWNLTQTLTSGSQNFGYYTKGYPGLVASSTSAATKSSYSYVYAYNPNVVYVNQAVSSSGVGYSWASGLKTLYEGITMAKNDYGNQIWVASGTYMNTTPYVMTSGDTIYGGFAGTEAYNYNVTQRNFVANPSILNGNSTGSVFTNSGNTSSSLLDGFTIMGGSATNGGGINNSSASPTLRNLIITGNKATTSGGGIYNSGSSAPPLINVLVVSNTAPNGGGIYHNGGSTTFTNVTIANNTATTNGGGVYNNASCTLNNCILWGNTATTGTQLYRAGGTTTLNYCYYPTGGTSGTVTTANCLVNTTNPFFNSSGADYRLAPSSLCIDAGSNSYYTSFFNALPYDIRGASNGRELVGTTGATGGTIDMGAYEYNPLMNLFYVKTTASGANNGTSWTNAYTSLQSALSSAFSTCKILVAGGSYTPTATSVLQSSVKLYGGFAGTPGTEIVSPSDLKTKLNSRNLKTNVSILTNSAAPVVSSSGTITGAMLDGFTINGVTTASTNYAVTLPSGADSIQNCKIINNAATGVGGLSLTTSNVARNILVANNGGVGVFMNNTTSQLINATIANNTGVAISSSGSSPTVTNSILWGNGGGNLLDTTLTITYSAATSLYKTQLWKIAGTGNIDLYYRSPNFKKANNYELLQISPCLRTGLASANTLATDANGFARTYNSTIDMGAFQKWSGYVANGTSISQYRSSNTFTPAQLAAMGSTTAGMDTVELLIPSASSLTLSGQNINAQWLILKDSSNIASPLAPMIMSTSGTSTVTADSVLYVRYFPKAENSLGVWSFFGLPYKTPMLSSIDGAVDENTVRIDSYSEHTRAVDGANKTAWSHLNIDSVLVAGRGYALSFNSKVPNTSIGTTVIFPSIGTSSPVTFSVSSSPTSNLTLAETSSTGGYNWYDCGWNLISNPLTQTGYFNNTGTTGYWPQTSNAYASYYGAVYMYQSPTDSYNVIPLSSFDSSTGGLSTFGACFVQTDYAGSIAQFTAGGSTTSPNRSQSLAAATATSSVPPPVQFQFTVAGAKQTSNAYVIFYDSAHADARAVEDAPTMSGVNGNTTLTLSTTATGSSLPLAINRLPFVGTEMEIPLQVTVPAAGTYTITMPESDSNTAVYIKDANNSYHDLTNAYSLTATTSETLNYTLVFGQTTRVQTDSSIGITLTQNKTSVTINTSGSATLQRVYVYSETGQLVNALENSGNEVQFNLPSANGIYLVKITTSLGSVTKKLINR